MGLEFDNHCLELKVDYMRGTGDRVIGLPPQSTAPYYLDGYGRKGLESLRIPIQTELPQTELPKPDNRH